MGNIMFDLEKYINDLIKECKSKFKERLLYIGLQGSYLRNEAHSGSDIDIMAVIDKLTADDLSDYRQVLYTIGYFDKSCGFICGKDELLNWNPPEICHLIHTTKDYYGKLNKLVPQYTRQDELNYIKISLNNLYHALCHSRVHSEDMKSSFPDICKSIFFIMQNMHYIETGVFAVSKAELAEMLNSSDKYILKTAEYIQHNADFDSDKVFKEIFEWCQNAILRI